MLFISTLCYICLAIYLRAALSSAQLLAGQHVFEWSDTNTVIYAAWFPTEGPVIFVEWDSDRRKTPQRFVAPLEHGLMVRKPGRIICWSARRSAKSGKEFSLQPVFGYRRVTCCGKITFADEKLVEQIVENLCADLPLWWKGPSGLNKQSECEVCAAWKAREPTASCTADYCCLV